MSAPAAPPPPDDLTPEELAAAKASAGRAIEDAKRLKLPEGLWPELEEVRKRYAHRDNVEELVTAAADLIRARVRKAKWQEADPKVAKDLAEIREKSQAFDRPAPDDRGGPIAAEPVIEPVIPSALELAARGVGLAIADVKPDQPEPLRIHVATKALEVLAKAPKSLHDTTYLRRIAAKTGLSERTLGAQLALLRKTKRAPKTKTEPKARRDFEERPEITDGHDVNMMTSLAERALLTRHAPIYSRGGQLVRIRRIKSGVVIESLPAPSLQELLSEHVFWTRPTTNGGSSPVKPPRAVVEALLARGTWSLREITALAEAPTLAPTGAVLTEDGWHESGVYVSLQDKYEYLEVPAAPTLEDAKLALTRLFTPFAEFPFVGEADESAALALVLTLVARPAIDGPIPMFVVRGPVAGSGKGKIVHVASACAFGREAPVSPPEKESSEERKSLLALGAEGAPLALLDNLEHALGSDVLAAALTSTTFKGRVLGQSKMLEVRLPVLAATGNNLQIKGDLARRCIPIDVDPQVEQPEGRVFDREQPAWAVEHHPELVAAALTALRAFVVAGKPQPTGLPPYGSFEAWSRLVRSCLVWAGISDPCGGRERLRAEADTGLAELDAALVEWRKVAGELPWSVREMLTRCDGVDGESLKEALAAFCRCEPKKLTSFKLGYSLRASAKRVVRGLRFESDGNGHARKWAVKGERPAE